MLCEIPDHIARTRPGYEKPKPAEIPTLPAAEVWGLIGRAAFRQEAGARIDSISTDYYSVFAMDIVTAAAHNPDGLPIEWRRDAIIADIGNDYPSAASALEATYFDRPSRLAGYKLGAQVCTGLIDDLRVTG